MQVTCPSCRAEYTVPDARLRPGLMMRCHRCGSEFAAPVPGGEEPPPGQAAEQASAGLPKLTATERVVRSVTAPPRNRALLLAWIGSLVLLVLIVAAALLWREQVARLWPAAARAYRSLG